jgi:aspartate-semialdehyde dehydrogenase
MNDFKDYTSVSIVGAGGLVGSELLTLLEEERIRIDDLRLFGTSSSAGEFYRVAGDEVEIREFRPELLKGSELVILAMPNSLPREILQPLLDDGACVVDLTPGSRLDNRTTLISPMDTLIGGYRRSAHISIASASAVQIASVVRSISRVGVVKRIVATTLQSVSDAGKEGLDELWEQSISIFNQRGFENEFFSHQIAFNCIPSIGTFSSDGTTSEERMILGEVQRLLGHDPLIPIFCTAVRVPVFHGSGVSLDITLDGGVSFDQVFSALKIDPVLSLEDDGEFPMHLSVVGQEKVQVGRVRVTGDLSDQISMWTAVDNVRAIGAKGALSVITDYISFKSHSA